MHKGRALKVEVLGNDEARSSEARRHKLALRQAMRSLLQKVGDDIVEACELQRK